MWATISAIPQPAMAIPAYWFVEIFASVLPFGLKLLVRALFPGTSPDVEIDAGVPGGTTLPVPGRAPSGRLG